MTNKVQATRLIQRHGLEGLPAIVLEPHERPHLGGVVNSHQRVTIRSGHERETKNLPRLVNAAPGEALEWTATLAPALDIIIQPAAVLEYSVEVLVTNGTIAWELVPGFWELDSSFVPHRGFVDAIGSRFTHSAQFKAGFQSARFVDAVGTRLERDSVVSDVQLATVVSWIVDKWDGLQALRQELDVDQVGMKIASYQGYGMSPQNLRSANGFSMSRATRDTPSSSAVKLPTLESVPPAGATEVILAFGVHREQHADLQEFAELLASRSVGVAWTRSGLLSHFAIMLREHGLNVRQLR